MRYLVIISILINLLFITSCQRTAPRIYEINTKNGIVTFTRGMSIKEVKDKMKFGVLSYHSKNKWHFGYVGDKSCIFKFHENKLYSVSVRKTNYQPSGNNQQIESKYLIDLEKRIIEKFGSSGNSH